MQSMARGLTSSFDFRWNARNNTSAWFGYSDDHVSGVVPTTSRGHIESVTHAWDFQRTLSLRLEYQYSDQTMEVPLQPEQPVDSHNARVALDWRKRLSRTRTVSFGGGPGVMRVRSVSSSEAGPLDYLTPSMTAQARLDLGRTWSVSANADRAVTVLDGVTQQSFLTDVGSLWLGGDIGESWVVALSGSFSRGAPHEGEIGSFEAWTGRAQLQFAVASCCAVVGTYSYYSHLMRDVSSVAPGFPSRVENKAVRVGMTFWLPLYGRFGAGRLQTGRN
jgi:hypothetical protein